MHIQTTSIFLYMDVYGENHGEVTYKVCYSLIRSVTPPLDCSIVFGSLQSKLTVTPASVEQSLSKLKLIKTQLRNRHSQIFFCCPLRATSELTIMSSLTFINSWPKEFCFYFTILASRFPDKTTYSL